MTDNIPLDPQVFLQYSDDGGHTWSARRAMSCGKKGEYSKHIRWSMLGMDLTGRGRIWKISWDFPARGTLMGGEVDFTVGKS